MLRGISTRAVITPTRFTNSYEWGDFKGDPAKFMETWLDLHLYFANWGTRRLMMRWPAHLVDRQLISAFLIELDEVKLWRAGQYLILDIHFDEMDADFDEDGTGWLSELAPLRADVIGCDLRMFYLLWLLAVQDDLIEADEPEPLPGLGPLSAALSAFVAFFFIDEDLVAAAAERPADPLFDEASSPETVRAAIEDLDGEAKTALLMRVAAGDPHVAAELKIKARERFVARAGAPVVEPRTAGALRARALAIRVARERAEAEQAARERKQLEEAAAIARRARVATLAKRGASVWHEVEAAILVGNAAGYDRALEMMSDLKVIADDAGEIEDFLVHVEDIRRRYARRSSLIKRLAMLE